MFVFRYIYIYCIYNVQTKGQVGKTFRQETNAFTTEPSNSQNPCTSSIIWAPSANQDICPRTVNTFCTSLPSFLVHVK